MRNVGKTKAKNQKRGRQQNLAGKLLVSALTVTNCCSTMPVLFVIRSIRSRKSGSSNLRSFEIKIYKRFDYFIGGFLASLSKKQTVMESFAVKVLAPLDLPFFAMQLPQDFFTWTFSRKWLKPWILEKKYFVHFELSEVKSEMLIISSTFSSKRCRCNFLLPQTAYCFHSGHKRFCSHE